MRRTTSDTVAAGRGRGPAGLLLALGLVAAGLQGCGETCDKAVYEAARHKARRAEQAAAGSLLDAEHQLRNGKLSMDNERQAIEGYVDEYLDESDGVSRGLTTSPGLLALVSRYDDKIKDFQRDRDEAAQDVGGFKVESAAFQAEAERLDQQKVCDGEDFSEAYMRADSEVGFDRRLSNLREVRIPDPGMAVVQAKLADAKRKNKTGPAPAPTPAPSPPPAPPKLDRIVAWLIGRTYRIEGRVRVLVDQEENEVPVVCTASTPSSTPSSGSPAPSVSIDNPGVGSAGLGSARLKADAQCLKALEGLPELQGAKVDLQFLARIQGVELVVPIYESYGPDKIAELRQRLEDELSAAAGGTAQAEVVAPPAKG